MVNWLNLNANERINYRKCTDIRYHIVDQVVRMAFPSLPWFRKILILYSQIPLPSMKSNDGQSRVGRCRVWEGVQERKNESAGLYSIYTSLFHWCLYIFHEKYYIECNLCLRNTNMAWIKINPAKLIE